MRFTAILCTVLPLGACATEPQLLWTRIDGQRITGNLAFEQQLQIDRDICGGEAQKASLSAGANYFTGAVPQVLENVRRDNAVAGVARGCMATRGYVLVPAEGADQARERLASTYKARQSASINENVGVSIVARSAPDPAAPRPTAEARRE